MIQPTAEGFSVICGDRELFRVQWQAVLEIVSFKKDLITTDCVYLAFRTSADARYFEVNEETEGFVLLTDEMMRHFNAIHPDWLSAVTQLPFATN